MQHRLTYTDAGAGGAFINGNGWRIQLDQKGKIFTISLETFPPPQELGVDDHGWVTSELTIAQTPSDDSAEMPRLLPDGTLEGETPARDECQDCGAPVDAAHRLCDNCYELEGAEMAEEERMRELGEELQ